MHKKGLFSYFPVLVAIAMLVLLVCPSPVLAEGEEPPTEPVATEPAPTEEPPTEPVATEPVPTEEPPAETQPTEEVPTETPPVEEVPTETTLIEEVPIETPTEEVLPVETVEEVVEVLAENNAVLVNESGEIIPLASEEVAVVLENPDPYVVRGGVTYHFMSDCTGYSNCTVTTTPIQTAINFSNPGETVVIEAGTFVEELDINKSITLQGSTGTVIQGFNSMAPDFSTTNPIIFVYGDANVVIDNITVDGLGLGNTNSQYIGIAFHNAGGTVSNSTIVNIMDTPFSSVQHGVGIYALNDDGVARTINIINNTVEDFQKNGMAFIGDGLAVNVEGNTVTGEGPTSVTGQNGIQVSGGATGTIQGNEVNDIHYTGSGWTASGILIQDASGTVEVKDNVVNDAQAGICVADSIANVNGNTIDGSDGWGVIIISDGSTIVGSGSIVGNKFLNNVQDVYTDNPDVTAHANVFSASTWGFEFDDYFSTGRTLNALYNYWGCDDGPDVEYIDPKTTCGIYLFGSSTYDPWLIDPDNDAVFSTTDGSSFAEWTEYLGPYDNCPTVANPDQLDSDSDGIGDVCDPTPYPAASGGRAGVVAGGATGLIPVIGGELVELSCEIANTLAMAGGSVEFSEVLFGYFATLTGETAETLPGALPAGDTFVGGLTLNLFKGEEAVTELESGTFTISFPIAAGMQGETFAILFWDGAAWVEVPSIVVGGTVQATINVPGTYMLVTK